jgi:hypothetical protein
MSMIPHNTDLHIGSLLFEGVDQIDLTGPFEVLSRIRNATYCIYGKTAAPVRDLKGLWLTPDATPADGRPSCTGRLRPGSLDSGTPETAPAAILEQARQSVRDITAQREVTARRVAARLGINVR